MVHSHNSATEEEVGEEGLLLCTESIALLFSEYEQR
jgi:hypothetical protein